MNVILIYPKLPETFWSFKYALKFISKKSAYPPLGLLTVASLLPEDWNKKLVDMNTSALKDKDLIWADYAFISAMEIQKESVKEVVKKCKELNTKIVAGGPLFTSNYDKFDHIDHLVLNEAEITLPLFLGDLKKGKPKHIYTAFQQWADMEKTPIPSWELINMKKYASMNIQYSRGCPFNCDFCDITFLYGHIPRTKNTDQILLELDSLYINGWRGGVFFVDDNFIGNKRKLKNEILPAIADWMKYRKYPFTFTTQASINLSDDEKLIQEMVLAGFTTVFVGIESPNEASLDECTKYQNKNRDLVSCVKKIQNQGLQVEGGFIVGFDSDPPSIFEKQIEFIRNSKIVVAMVGLLNAPRGTKLYRKLKGENRLLNNPTGDNTDFSINFIPKLQFDTLIAGYRRLLKSIYIPKFYYRRVIEFLKDYEPKNNRLFHFDIRHLEAFIKSIVRLGLIGKERIHYWKLLFWTIFKRPRHIVLAVTFAIYGFHFRKIFEKCW
ncbi:MAG: B12-binding domain-containing radical SAM protein [Candidatus Marinimicrobia bacterium]|nr:B12-binding domain-containing radical SAM protein [Candidatus Neomarinimicrobiota bacterium]